MAKAAPRPGPARHVPRWLRLDNAAKIYPAARSDSWMAVFRLSVTLAEPIDEGLLQQALERTLKRVPMFGYRLRRGLFWYYLDENRSLPQVRPDALNPCMPIQLKRNDHLLFRIRVHEARIAIELFHALADGTGAMTFLMTLAAEYLRLKHGQRIPSGGYILDCRDAPRPEEWEDSFPVYARGARRGRGEEAAYPLRGTREKGDYLRITCGRVDTAQLSMAAKRYGGTINTPGGMLLSALIDIARRPKQRRSKSR